jgi:predicted lipid-binding transport protein (Tim44 family)
MAANWLRPQIAFVKSLFTSVFLLALGAAETTWGRGGGGCLEQGTLILTPAGNVPVEQLRPGDAVLTVNAGKLRRATVQARIEVQPEEYLSLTVAGRTLKVTPEHPFAVGDGEFRLASHLRAGDTLRWWDGHRLQSAALGSIERVKAAHPAFDLLVAPFGMFLADGVLVHNKGCFLPDTPVLRADGSTAMIRDVRPGDSLLAFTAEGEIVHAVVREVLAHEVDEYLVVGTGNVVVRVTAEHPFYVGNGTFKTLDALRVGDRIFTYNGHELSAQKIVSLEKVQARTRVYNLRTDSPHTFFANGIAVHNKGGCFPAGTPVQTPAGDVAVEKLEPGDTVVAVDERGRVVRTRVEATHNARSPLLSLDTDAGELRTTAEHPLLLRNGDFRDAGACLPGDEIMVLRRRALHPTTIRKRTEFTEPVPVFNLQVSSPHTFIAAGFVVHNKGGGCFPAGTSVATPQGQIAIEQLAPGNMVLAMDAGQRLVQAAVRKLLVTRSPLLILTTDAGILRTTPEHPLQLAEGGFRAAGALIRGDRILVWRNGHSHVAIVQRTDTTLVQTEVFNLEVSAPHTFIADGFVVHNKGGGFGGGGYHGGGSSGGSDDGDDGSVVAFFIFFGAVVLILVIGAARKKRDENLDFVFDRSAIAPKAMKTLKLLEFIAKVDPAFTPAELEKVAESTFVQLQKCWQARRYEPMKPLLMPDLYADHCAQLAGMIRNHEINVISGLEVKRIDIVNVRYTHNLDGREFAALITARAKDYYIDDRSREFLRGDDSLATFQEFWTFQLVDGSWRLREIEQSRESDALKDENFFEQFTDEGLNQVYAEAASSGGPVGPWLEKATETKATRIERMLNFLVTTDRIWNRQRMLERARQVFIQVFAAWERGDPAAIPSADLFPEYAAKLADGIGRQKADGVTAEYRNLCVRKVELILVRNFADNSRDEFTVRISAHAQYIVKQHGQLIQQDEYVSPFVEYWTFGRRDGLWKLKEVLPPAEGEQTLARENVDEESSPEQLQWYYQKTRAV